MIDLNIFQFGGRGGSSGRGGSAGGPGGGSYGPPETERPSFKDGRVKGENNIRGSESYTLYEVKDKNDSNEKASINYQGSTIRDRIAHETLIYDRRQEVWIDKETGKVYVIRLRRTR